MEQDKLNSEAEKKQIRSSKVVGGFILLVLMALGGTLGKEFVENLFKTSPKISDNTSNWNRRQISNTGIAIETPFELHQTALKYPEEYMASIQETFACQYASTPLSVDINYIIYKAKIEKSVDVAAEEVVSNMKKLEGIENFSYKISGITKQGLNGRIIECTFSITNRQAAFVQLLFVDNNKLWNIFFRYLNNEDNKNTVDRIINSVEITL